jgi:hypothetical protein
LCCRSDSCLTELVLQTSSVGAFQKAGPQFGVDLYGGSDYSVADFLRSQPVNSCGSHRRVDLRNKLSRPKLMRKVTRHKI